MSNIVYRGAKFSRSWYLRRVILNRINQKIARRNIRNYPQLAIFAFDNIGLRINLEGRYELDSLDILERFLTDCLRIDTDTTVLDVGANIGNHSVFFAGIFSKVIAFEPNPQAFALLTYNTAGSNIVPLNYGLSSEESTIAFSIDRTNIGGSRVVHGGSGSGLRDLNMIEIEVRRLDDESKIWNERVSLIKIDVEGHEMPALRGASKFIEATHPVIVFEQGEDAISDGTTEVIEFLRVRDYRFFTIESNFYFGQGLAARISSLLLRMLFGFRKEIVPTQYFKKRFYDMIIAVPLPPSA